MTDNDRLTQALRQRADRLDAELGTAHPISLDDVRGRARGIRRRRVAASGLAAVAVLAVAVPVGLSVTDRTVGDVDRGPAATATADPTGTPSTDPTGSPLPDHTRKVLLTNEVDATSGAPGIPYLRDGVILTPEGDEVNLDAGYDAFARHALGWVALDSGASRVDLLDEDGDLVSSHAGTWPLAVNAAEGSVDIVVAWPTDDRRLVVSTAQESAREVGRWPGLRVQPVAVVGAGVCVDEARNSGCPVFLTLSDEQQGTEEAYAVTWDGQESRVRGLLSVTSVSPDGLVAGFTSRAQDGTCSAVLGVDGAELWETCDHSLGRFSPDGRFVIGHPAYRSGVGDASVAIIDATTGEVFVDFQSDIETQAFVHDLAWDTDGTLLATVYERGTWAVMRMTADGQLSEVLGGLGGGETEVPVRFAAQP